MSTLANSEDPGEIQHNAYEMLHFIRIYTVCNGKKDLQTKEFFFFLQTPIYMYYGLSQVSCTKPEGRIH